MFSSEHNFTVTADSLTKITPPGPLPQFQRTHTRYGFTIYMEEIWRLLKLRPVPISNPFSTVKLGSIMFCPSNEQGEEPAEVAFFPEADPYLRPWAPVLTHTVDFQIDAYGAKQKPSTGFLFLCPKEHFQITTASFRWPEYPAYWSRDPNGVERLSIDKATFLGFPPLEFKSRTQGFSWDSNVYAGLRRFQEEEGFDPDTPAYATMWAGDSMLFEVRDTRANLHQNFYLIFISAQEISKNFENVINLVNIDLLDYVTFSLQFVFIPKPEAFLATSWSNFSEDFL
ncbi:hypothetical protein C8J57DRAFT_1247672 [Mycena rebaudengoi]|nr:hypothetical protein C8J57DRAFT_1247672 [Mycena rebaudengoi]